MSEETKTNITTKVVSGVSWFASLLVASIASYHIGTIHPVIKQSPQIISLASDLSGPCTEISPLPPIVEAPVLVEPPVVVAEPPKIEESPIVIEEKVQSKTELKAVRKYYLLMRHPDGRYELRTGGSPAWRYNNPGKLAYGNFAKLNGALGNDGPLAIFSTYEDGKKAFESFLFESDFNYKDLSIEQVINKLADIKKGYKPKEYLAFVLKETNQKSSKLLKDMTVDERDELIEAIQSYENWIAGNIVIYKDKTDFEKKGY